MTRQLIGILGILLAVLGLAYDSRWLIWVAIGVLMIAFLWRIVDRLRDKRVRERSGN
jgi:nicotinamide riboside transporter PnuC